MRGKADTKARVLPEADWRRARKAAEKCGWPAEWIRSDADVDAVVNHGCWFDEAAVEDLRFFFEEGLRHTKGRWAGKPFTLLRWQAEDVLYPLFAWKRPNGTRRFRRAYIEVPKKNGKSTISAGVALYLLLYDGEAGAEIYGAASDRKQAGIVFNEAASMVRQSAVLSKHLKVIDSRKHITHLGSGSFYTVLSSDAFRNEGINAHGVIFDELHAQPNSKLWDALYHAGVSRTQPLQVAITTAGSQREGVCWNEHETARQIIEGNVFLFQRFAYIRSISDPEKWEEQWQDPAEWANANPSFGETMDQGEFGEEAATAAADPSKLFPFLRYRLNVWIQGDNRAFDLGAWEKCAESFDDSLLLDRPCFGGLDLASKIDLASWAKIFPPCERDPYWRYTWDTWTPRDTAMARGDRDGADYELWIRDGQLHATEGNVIDYETIRKKILADSEAYNIVSIGYDPWNATNMALNLQADGLDVVEVRQGYASLSEAFKEMMNQILSDKMRHRGGRLLRWVFDNTCAKSDDNDNKRPIKASETKRIDPVVAAVTGLAVALQNGQDGSSVYSERGLLTI